MELKQTTIHTFNCPFINGQLMQFNVAAESPAEAADIFKGWLEQAQKELALLFPKVAPAPETPALPMHESGLNGMQIMLLDDLVKAIKPDSVNLTVDVKLLTDLDMNAKNFKKIIPLLEAKKNG